MFYWKKLRKVAACDVCGEIASCTGTSVPPGWVSVSGGNHQIILACPDHAQALRSWKKALAAHTERREAFEESLQQAMRDRLEQWMLDNPAPEIECIFSEEE